LVEEFDVPDGTGNATELAAGAKHNKKHTYELCLYCRDERHFNHTNNIDANIGLELILPYGNYQHLL
jgi:hypothetical protein